MFLPLIFAMAVPIQSGDNSLVCRYDPDRNGSHVILRFDGTIRFVSKEIADKDSVMKADTFKRTSAGVRFRVVMVGRTDTFDVSLKTLLGTQRISRNGEAEKVFHLVCGR